MSAALKQAAQALRRIAEFNYSGRETPADIARSALSAIEEAPQQEPVAWAVWRGLGEMRKNSVHFERSTAAEVAIQIKSYTEVRPLYAAPQQAQQGVDSYALDLLIAAGHVSEGEVEKARKISARYQPLQQAQAPGWKLVPVEPTPEMVSDGGFAETSFSDSYRGDSIAYIGDESAKACWAAMLAAAPQGDKP